MQIGNGTWDLARPGHELIEELKSEFSVNGKPDAAKLQEFADKYSTTVAKVKGVIGYYAELEEDDATVHVCSGESCRSRGAAATISRLELEGETVKTLHCAGLCASGPAVIRPELTSSQSPLVPVSQRGEGLQFYISQDSMSLDLGSESIALSVAEMLPDSTIIRTGSRGLFYFEPMLEYLHEGERHAYRNVSGTNISAIIEIIQNGHFADHEHYLGLIRELPELTSQKRYAMEMLGVHYPLDLPSLITEGVYSGLTKADAASEISRTDPTTPSEYIISEIQIAGLRGRGGAGFPTHFKWRSAATETNPQKYVIANADEGDAGTFIDRMIMEGDPHSLIEGMAICALAINASKGIVYLRSEYPRAKRILQKAIDDATTAGYLGDHFSISIASGAGSYVCGEETALLESLEGRRGEVRVRPPYPTQEGLYGCPTIVNNVLTFALAASILRHGSSEYSRLGCENSKGTVVAQIVGAVTKPACVEVEFGATIGELFSAHSSDEGVVALQVGGPLGGVHTLVELKDIELSFEGLSSAGGLLGHGGFVCYDSNFDPRAEVLEWMTFFRDESCGKCTPCRIGTQRALELLSRIGTEAEMADDKLLLADLDDVMSSTSLCALGGLAMNPVRSTMQLWPSAFGGDANE
ncbi:MAG: formate dehydrogenase [Euryarchaeota archaeon]|nr:formate dehydrogenase [Euryarchaeota archaeon]